MANIKNAILSALIEGAVYDLFVKTGTDNVYLPDGTTLSAKLSEFIISLNSKATQEALESGLSARPTTAQMNSAISTAVAELVDGAPEALNTLKELADAISENEDLMDALTSAIGNKADASVVASIKATVDALGTLSTKSVVSESDLDATLRNKINSATSLPNESVLSEITEEKVQNWDGKGRFYASSTQPVKLTEKDLWIRLI